jgi:ribosomal protein S18 acetylase RimI-like enzyme
LRVEKEELNLTETVICLHDKGEIEKFLRQDTFLNLYALGDLDDFFWQYTNWYALKDGEEIRELVMVYMGITPPVIHGLTSGDVEGMRELVRGIIPFLPRRFEAHFTPGVVDVLAEDYAIESRGLHFKMALVDPSRLAVVDTSRVVSLSEADSGEIEALYRDSYPGNWFDPRMLETGCYYGVRADGRLVSIAGIHTYSPGFRVAVIGNITTHPAYRNQGLGAAVSAKLCLSLLESVDHIGLNVSADNAGAIACYTKLGFERNAVYEEFDFELK